MTPDQQPTTHNQPEKAVTRKKRYKPGDRVLTQGCESGQWYECTVTEPVLSGGKWNGEYDLDSPAHGYVIRRHYTEMEHTL